MSGSGTYDPEYGFIPDDDYYEDRDAYPDIPAYPEGTFGSIPKREWEPSFDLQAQFDKAIKRKQMEEKGLSIGFPEIERCMDGGGFLKGQLVSIISKPKVGKTYMVCNAIHNLIGQGKKSLFISVEMNSHAIIDRMLRLELNCGYEGVKEAMVLNERKVRDIGLGWSELVMLADMKEINLEQIRQCIDRFGPEAVFVDYVQIVNANGQQLSEMEKVSKVIKGLADMAQVMDTRVFSLSQTTKDEVPGWQMPSASSGKWSSDIHIASDVLIGMCRPDTNPKQDEGEHGIVLMQLLETRYGNSSDAIPYHYDKETTRLIERDTWHALNDPRPAAPVQDGQSRNAWWKD